MLSVAAAHILRAIRMRLRRGPLADFLLEPHKVPVGVLDEELPDADLYIARPVPLLFGFDEDRPSCFCDALQRAVQIVDLNLKVDTLTKGELKGSCRPRPTLVDLVKHQVRVTQDKLAESFLRPLIAKGKTDEVAPKTARCLVIGDGKFRDKPGLVAHGLTLAASDEANRVALATVTVGAR